MPNKNEDSIVVPMIRTSNRLQAIANKYVFVPMRLSPISVSIMSILKANGKSTPGDLLKLVNSTKSNISQRLNFLEKEGLISRNYINIKEDKRKVVIILTPKGKSTLIMAEKRLKKGKVALEKNFTQKEISQNRKFLEKMNELLDVQENELEKIFKKR